MPVTRKDRKRNDDIITELGLTLDIINRIQQKRPRYCDHVVRMKNYRLPKIALYGRVYGTRPRGRPRKRWMDNIREDYGRLNLDINQADRLARDRDEWRRVLFDRACNSIAMALRQVKSVKSSQSSQVKCTNVRRHL